MSITHLTYQQIDKKKWDGCINQSRNRLIYAQSFYLDAMAENWDALVLNDYEAVMPLTWKKKWGVRYLYQPAFMQQGGVFFTAEISDSILQDFIDKAFSLFKFAEITLNYLNGHRELKIGNVSMRNNFILSLQSPYEEIYEGFSAGTKKYIKRAATRGLNYQSSPHYLPILELYKELYGERLPNFVQTDYGNFSIVCKKLHEQNNLVIRTVTNRNGDLLAAVVMLIDCNRFYNIVPCVTEEGKKEDANYLLYNGFIREFGNSNYILDFEGSDKKGIADFYKKFATKNQPYPFVKINNLHPVLKLFKH